MVTVEMKEDVKGDEDVKLVVPSQLKLKFKNKHDLHRYLDVRSKSFFTVILTCYSQCRFVYQILRDAQ